MDYFIDNYDEMLNYYGLFSLFVDNTESGYTAYVDGIYAIKAREPATKTEVESFNDRRALSGVLAGVNNARATEQLNKDYIPTPVGDRDPSGGGFLKLDMPASSGVGATPHLGDAAAECRGLPGSAGRRLHESRDSRVVYGNDGKRRR